MVATDAVYFTDAFHGTVNKAGIPTPLATNEGGATFLQQVATNLYWYAKGSRKIRKMATTGGTITDVYTAPPSSGGAVPPDVGGFLVTPDGQFVFVSLGNQVLEAQTSGGLSVVVANEVHGGIPEALALNGTTNIVYPTGLNGDVDAPLLSAMPATCGMEDAMGNVLQTTCPRLGRSQGELFPSFVAVIAGHAYWVDGPNVKGELIGAMGGTFDSIAQTDFSITAAAATTNTIYFADADLGDPTHGFVEKTPLAPNSTPTRLARGQNLPIALAVDSTKVYWANSDCAIWSHSR
jgi:hypothetical protein